MEINDIKSVLLANQPDLGCERPSRQTLRRQGSLASPRCYIPSSECFQNEETWNSLWLVHKAPGQSAGLAVSETDIWLTGKCDTWKTFRFLSVWILYFPTAHLNMPHFFMLLYLRIRFSVWNGKVLLFNRPHKCSQRLLWLLKVKVKNQVLSQCV